MYKYLAILSLPLIGCVAHVKPCVIQHNETVIDPHPVKVELERGVVAQAMACSDDFDCMNKLTGLCPNGYSWSHNLLGEMNKRVGVVFNCITDEEKAAIDKQKAEDEAFEQETIRRRKAALEEIQKKK